MSAARRARSRAIARRPTDDAAVAQGFKEADR